jgi:predicted enzyme related to lactoylglutathione lyase
MLKNLSSLMVYTRDMQRSVAFYRDTLGFKLDMESPFWSQFDLGDGVILGLHHADEHTPAQPVGGWQPTFLVDDVVAAKQAVLSAGSTTAGDLHDIPGGVVYTFTDPDNNQITVQQNGVTCAQLGVMSA